MKYIFLIIACATSFFTTAQTWVQNPDGTWVQNYNVATVSDAAITNAKIAPSAVDASKVQDGTLTRADMAQDGAQAGQSAVWDGTAWVNRSNAGHMSMVRVNAATYTTTGNEDSIQYVFAGAGTFNITAHQVAGRQLCISNHGTAALTLQVSGVNIAYRTSSAATAATVAANAEICIGYNGTEWYTVHN